MLSSECRSVDIPRARLSSIAGIAIGCCVACICPAIFATFANPTTNVGLHAFSEATKHRVLVRLYACVVVPNSSKQNEPTNEPVVDSYIVARRYGCSTP